MKKYDDLFVDLDDVLFKYQRISSLLICIQTLIEGNSVEITGLPDKAISYSLFEIDSLICENNNKLRDIVERIGRIKQGERAGTIPDPLFKETSCGDYD